VGGVRLLKPCCAATDSVKEKFLVYKMNHYERLAARYVFLKQDAKLVGKQVKDLTEKRKRLNKEVKVLRRVLLEMRRYPITTFFDDWTEVELDELIKKGFDGATVLSE
jgi:hypothetical protein